MSGQMKNYKSYKSSLDSMCGPYSPDEIPKVRIDLKGLSSYAKRIGKTVPELSDEEKQPFVVGLEVQELKRQMIRVS